MQHTDDVILKQLVLLTAQELPASPPAAVKTDPETAFGAGGISYSQLNELLLSFRYDRVSKGFFNYFFLTTEDRERLSRENFQVDYNSETPLRISSLDGFVKVICASNGRCSQTSMPATFVLIGENSPRYSTGASGFRSTMS